jgi:predicted DNA repair protein MutK
MATGILVILDDIATLLDDAATMSKIAARKTASVLSDDLSVSAEKASKFSASRELPVLWAITKGSFINKLIILPFAFLLSAFAPWSIIPILMLGGAYLAYEGSEKIYEYIHKKIYKTHAINLDTKLVQSSIDENEILRIEKTKVKSAILTDFILSIEIIIIALSTAVNESLTTQIISTTVVAFLATIGVYGAVALIVRLDDIGLYISKKSKINSMPKLFGNFLVTLMPKIIKSLGVIGTFAMLLVAGGIYTHSIKFLHDNLDGFNWYISLPIDTALGAIIGIIALVLIQSIKRAIKHIEHSLSV